MARGSKDGGDPALRSFTRRGFVRIAAVPAASVFFAACSQAAPTAAPEPKPAAPTQAPAVAPTQAPVVPATPAAAKPATTGDKKTWSFQSFTGGSQELLWNGYNYTEWRKAFPEYEHNFSWFSYGAYKDKMPAQIASGDIPDVMMVNAVNDIPLLMANNMIIPLNDHLKSQGKELMQRTPPEYFATATYQGQHMYMPATWNPNLWVTHTRVDWLQKLGVKAPVTLEDYELLMDAYTNKDPDGNGKKDTYAYEINTALYFDDWMFHAFGVAVGHHHNGFWRKRGSKTESDWVQPGMKEALNWIAGQWKKGVFHPNSPTGDITSRTGWASGITGFIYTSAPGTFSTQTALRAIVKDAVVAAIDPPKGPGGQGSSGEGMQWGYCISKKAKNPEDVVRMHNWQ